MEVQNKEELVRLIVKMVMEGLYGAPSIPLGVSNRHIHLDRADMDALFGNDSQLTHMKDLAQPGQYASKELVTIKGPRGELKKVRVLGPLRGATQVEISINDGFALGVKPPVRESGKLENTPGLEIIGPNGSVKKSGGSIVAWRHIHMTPADAERFGGLKDGDSVSVEVGSSERKAVFSNVLVRVSDQYALEMHIDVDEANAVGAKNGDLVFITK